VGRASANESPDTTSVGPGFLLTRPGAAPTRHSHHAGQRLCIRHPATGAFPPGAALLPTTTLIMVGMVVLAPRAMRHFGPKPMIVTGLLILSAGLAILSLVRATGDFWVDVLPASPAATGAMALVFIRPLGTAIAAARPEEDGPARRHRSFGSRHHRPHHADPRDGIRSRGSLTSYPRGVW
jgi:hypothetical protein